MGAALVAIAILAAAGLWLEARSARRYQRVEEAAADGAPPLDLLFAGGRAHRFVFMGGVSTSGATVRVVSDAVTRLARSVGVDALVVGVGEDHQALIDGFVRGDVAESELVARPAAAGGPGLPLVPLYTAVRVLNRELGAARSVRVIAAAPAGWPPARALAPAAALVRWSGIDGHMATLVEERVLAREPRARIIFFLDALHALRVPFLLRAGGTAPVTVTPLAMRFIESHGREVWSVLIDAPPSAGMPLVAAFAGSPARDALRRSGARAFALPAGEEFGQADDWIRVATAPGLQFEVAGPFAALTHAYVYLPD